MANTTFVSGQTIIQAAWCQDVNNLVYLGSTVGTLNNTALGISALAGANSGTGLNTAIGSQAATANTTGHDNTAIGNTALLVGTTSNYETAVGSSALSGLTTTSNSNVGVGYAAGSNLTSTCVNNTCLGTSTMGNGSNVTGSSYNVAVGGLALSGLTGVMTSNTAVGYLALSTTTACVGNTAVGWSALLANTGGNCTAIGYNAGSASTTGANNTFIGNGAVDTTGGVGAANTIVLGNSSITTLRCQTATISALSDARDKTDIVTLPFGLDFVMQLKPVSFTWNQRDGGRVGQKAAGFIAQDLDALQTASNAQNLDLVDTMNPDMYAARYGNLLPVIVKALQDLKTEFDAYKAAHP